MNTIYTLEPSDKNKVSIFLAGPTYRVKENQTDFNRSWRQDAIDIFSNLDFTGTLYIPEWRDNIKPSVWTYTKQVEWEVYNLKHSNVVMFWIPRNLTDLPAFTTNVEFGEYLHANSVAGSPNDAVKNEYLKERFRLLGKPWFDSLEELCKYAILKVRFGRRYMADEKLILSVKELLSAIAMWQETLTLKEVQSLSYESLSACTAITRAANEVKDLLND